MRGTLRVGERRMLRSKLPSTRRWRLHSITSQQRTGTSQQLKVQTKDQVFRLSLPSIRQNRSWTSVRLHPLRRPTIRRYHPSCHPAHIPSMLSFIHSSRSLFFHLPSTSLSTKVFPSPSSLPDELKQRRTIPVVQRRQRRRRVL